MAVAIRCKVQRRLGGQPVEVEVHDTGYNSMLWFGEVKAVSFGTQAEPRNQALML